MDTNNQNNNLETVNKSIFRRIWRVARIPLAVIFVSFVALMIYRYPAVKERIRTEEVVKQIRAQKLTLTDVMGENLPPEPDANLNDATLEGVDANYNGIRDDVEIAIFKLHPDSARIRAAQLQYAMALQNEMTSKVFNSETLVAVIQKEGRAFSCIGETAPKVTLQDSNEKWTEQDKVVKTRVKEVVDFVLNTEIRKQKQNEIYKKYMTSFKELQGENCDIDLKSLSN